jgi:hypothetical protein
MKHAITPDAQATEDRAENPRQTFLVRMIRDISRHRHKPTQKALFDVVPRLLSNNPQGSSLSTRSRVSLQAQVSRIVPAPKKVEVRVM